MGAHQVIQEYLAPIGALVLVAAYVWITAYAIASVITWLERKRK